MKLYREMTTVEKLEATHDEAALLYKFYMEKSANGWHPEFTFEELKKQINTLVIAQNRLQEQLEAEGGVHG